MPLTLAFDATAGRCAVALFDGARLLAERVEAMDRGHAERLFPLIRACLDEAGLKPPDLDLIAVSTGPGNFTGARIGVAAARGLALSSGARAVGVDRFMALAEGRGDVVCVALEARGGSMHAARYEHGALSGAARTLPPEEAAPMASGAALVGDAARRLAAVAPGAGPIADETADAPLAAIAAIAARLAAEDAPRPAPRYLRPAGAALPATPPPRILP